MSSLREAMGGEVVALIGDSKAYVILQKHGALIEPLRDKSVRLSLEGRVFVLTFLLFTDLITKETFNSIAENAKNPTFIGFATAVKIREACQNWLNVNAESIAYEKPEKVYPTDLTFRQMAFLFGVLIAGQEAVEWQKGGKPQ